MSTIPKGFDTLSHLHCNTSIMLTFKRNIYVYEADFIWSKVLGVHFLTVVKPFLPIVWILKHSESASVYASDTTFGWSQRVFRDHPPNQNIYYLLYYKYLLPSETIQMACLMHKLIWIHSVFLLPHSV